MKTKEFELIAINEHYYINNDCIRVLSCGEEMSFYKEDLPYLKKAIKLFEKRIVGEKLKNGN